MMRCVWLSLVLLVGCTNDESVDNAQPSESAPPGGKQSSGSAGSNAPPPTADQLVADMNAAIESLMASPEHSDEEITLQHVLIGFDGARATELQPRSRRDAEYLAAEIFHSAKSGEDFTDLMKRHTDDPGPGTYEMTKKGRRSMVAGFGNVGFRLQPGMIGVSPYDKADSPFGWHIIKRIK